MRDVQHVYPFSRTRASAEAFAAEIARWPDPPEVHLDATIPEAIRRADLIITATTAGSPLFGGKDARPGTHIAAVGVYTPDRRELDATTVRRSQVIVDSREAASSEAGDLLLAEATIDAELGEMNPVSAYRMAEAIGRPIAATASGCDWAFVKANGCEELVRIWIALSYACGQRLMVPHRMWCHTPELGTHWYDGPTEAYALPPCCPPSPGNILVAKKPSLSAKCSTAFSRGAELTQRVNVRESIADPQMAVTLQPICDLLKLAPNP